MRSKRGRPLSSRDTRVTAEFRTEPDVQMLARAFIAVAMNIAKQKADAPNTPTPFSGGKGDGMA